MPGPCGFCRQLLLPFSMLSINCIVKSKLNNSHSLTPRKARANSSSRSPATTPRSSISHMTPAQHPGNVRAITSPEREREHHQRSTCSSGSRFYANVISVSRTQSHEGISRTESSDCGNRKLGEGHDVAGTTLLILALASTAVVLVLVAFIIFKIRGEGY